MNMSTLEPPGFCDDPEWVEAQQERWLDYMLAKRKREDRRQETPVYLIEEACGFQQMEAFGIIEQALKRLRKNF